MKCQKKAGKKEKTNDPITKREKLRYQQCRKHFSVIKLK